MQRIGVLAILLGASCFGALAQSNTLKTDALLKVCTAPAQHWVDFCNGFFQAAHDVGAEAGSICARPGVTRADLAKVFEENARQLLHENPSKSRRSGVGVAIEIFREAYPCS